MSDAQPLRRPIVDPWAPDSTIPVQAGALTRERPAIVDPWRSAGQDPGPTANNAQPKSASPSLFRTAGDLARLGGGGIVTGTGRAIEGIERGIADNFRESKPGRVRFLDESGQPAPMTESQRERLRAWAERNPAYEPSRVSQSLKRTGESIQEGVSPSMKQAMADSEIDGDILSPSTWTLGKDPSARGLLGHITKVGGEMAPIVAAGAIPVVGPGAAVAAATGQSYSGAYEEAHDHVLNAPADELEKSSRYRELITAGLSEGDARKVLADEAGRGAAGVAAPIGGVSGAILGGVATKPLQNAIASRAGNTFGARLLGNLAEMPLEGLQEVAESMGGRYGANQAAGLDRDLSEGTFADFTLGAAAAGPAAVVHSASSGTPRGDRDSGMTAQERAELIASDTPPAATPLALPPPGAITVDSEGNAMTPAQARERESLGLTPDVRRAQAQQDARQAVTFPDAAPGSLADAANALPQGGAPALADGSPLPDPAGGPLSRAVSDGVATGAIPTGATTWEQAQAAIALDAADTRQSAQREREMDAILRESRLPAALYDAEVARAAGVDEVARAPTAMELAMQRARSEAEAKSTRAAIVDPWTAPNTPESAKSQGANLRFAENSTSYAPGDQSYAPQDPSLDPALITQSPDSITPVRFEPLGANGLLVYGDAAEIRARLAEVGFPKKGRNRDGALRFDAADRQALEAALMHGVDPARVPQGQARAEGSVGIPADVGSVQSITPNIAPAQAPAVGRLAAPITPPWMNSATEETSTPTTEQIRTAVEQQVAAQYRHNGSTGVNSPALSRAWGVPQKDVSRIARQVRANFDPARVESAGISAAIARARDFDPARVESGVPVAEPARAAGRTQPRPAIRDPFAVPQDTADGSTAPSGTSASTPPASTATVATHTDPGQPSEPATPAVMADSAAAVARAPNVTMPQAKREVFSQIDAALAKANTDAWPDMPEGSSMAARGRRQAAEDERERITRTAGYVTFDVPGDGSFRVVNNKARLEAFRAQVERQFKNTSLPTPKPPRIAMTEAERARVMAEAQTLGDDAPLFSRARTQPGTQHGGQEVDAEYLAAVERGDMKTAQRLVNEAATRAGYEPESAHRMRHSAPNSEDDVSLADVRELGLVPDDYWTHPHFYMTDPRERAAMSKLQGLFRSMDARTATGKPPGLASITVYRAVPKSVKEASIRNGDWVSPSVEYARDEGASIPGGYRIISQQVSAKNLWWDGNSAAELGYDDGKGYAYRNTRNNRKLLDTVTRDDAGNVIPLSRRFQARNADPRFSRTQGQAATGLPVENVQRIAADFLRQYRGNIPLEVKVGRTLEELYGLNAGGLGAAKGAYHPKSRVLTLAADRLSSRADVESTIRHEALGHYGLNTLAPDDKRAVLDAILTSRNQRSLASVWAQVDALYADMPESVRAEEVFAELASRERGTLGEWWDRILALLARGLRNVGLLRGDTSKAELHDLARRIAEGIRSGHAQQQTFPENDQSQFNRARAGDAGKTPSGVGELSAEQLEVLRSLGLLSPEQEADLSGRGGETSDQPTNRWGERLIPEAEARAHLRDGTRGTADPVAGRAHVPVGAPGRAAGRAGEHLQLPDHAEGQSSPGARGDSDDGRATSRLLGVVRRLSESASDQLAGVPTATRHLDSRVGPFSGTETRARIKNQGTAQEALVVEVYGKEQIAAGLDEEPALAWTVNARTGELDVNGPNPDRGTFREFQKRGWADHARGQDGEIAVGWTALRNPDGGATLPIGQIIPMLADVHARYRALRKEDRVGLRWSRITGATGGPAGREASVFFSRARMPKHLSEAQRDALSQIRSFATPESLPKRARRVLGELRRELVQGVFDQFQPIQALDETAYMQARLSRGTDGVLESLFLHGTPFLRDGAFDVKADGQGLRGVLSELQGEHDLFLSWIAGHRAAQLKKQGREHLFSAQQIDALKALNRGKMPDGSDRAAAYRKALAGYNRYQKAVLDIGEQAGLFSAKSRATWESEFYIPFFRDFDAEQQNEPSPYREPGTQKVIQQLEGGRQPLGDLLTNVLENHSRILTASMRNMAADKALRAAEQAGMAVKVDTGSKDTHRVMRQGAPVHYQVADAPLVDALTMLHFNGESNKTVQVLGAFKRALSFGVTISPGFRIRNLLRDTISAMSVADTADVTWNPLKQLVAGGKNVVRGWKASEHGSPMFQRLLAGGGAVRFGTLNDGAQSQYARRLIATGVNPDQILDTATKLKRGVQAAFQWWQDIGDRGETVNRAVIYERAIQAGKNHLQASYEARDLIDFTAGGKWAAVRFLSQTVPFFNARLQGMYKLGRAARGDFERFATVTGTVALASALLYLLQHDDEEYQALPDWARDAYWCINLGGTMLFIPKPFEVGALGSVVERGTELMVAGEDYQARDFTRSVTSIISDQLQMNPVPQAVRPLMEVAFNRDTFRGRPIDGMGQERLPAEDRYTARTSAAAVMAGRATNVSPQRIEHLVKGYFGWLGVQALNVADIATRPMTNLPSNPTRDMTSVSNWPVAGEFLRDASSVSSKYVERFYTMQQQNEELYAAFSAARAAGDIDRAMKLADTDAVQNRAFHNAAKRQMQEVGRSIRQVTADPSLSVRQKNELLTHFQAIRNQIAHQVDQITRAR